MFHDADYGVVWSMYFSGIVSFQYHPSNPPESRLTIEQCAEIADEMMNTFQAREVVWRGSVQQS